MGFYFMAILFSNLSLALEFASLNYGWQQPLFHDISYIT